MGLEERLTFHNVNTNDDTAKELLTSEAHEVSRVISGGKASTAAMKDSTEIEQFEKPEKDL